MKYLLYTMLVACSPAFTEDECSKRGKAVYDDCEKNYGQREGCKWAALVEYDRCRNEL